MAGQPITYAMLQQGLQMLTELDVPKSTIWYVSPEFLKYYKFASAYGASSETIRRRRPCTMREE